MTIIKLIWSKLSIKDKIVLAIFILGFIYIIYLSARIAYKDHLLIKRVSDDIEKISEKQKQNIKTTDSILKLGKTTTNKAVKRKKEINKKLEDDKKNIDNTDYPISKIDSLLSSYGN